MIQKFTFTDLSFDETSGKVAYRFLSRRTVDPESRQFIHERYQDTSVVIFKDQQKRFQEEYSHRPPRAKDEPDKAGPSTVKYTRFGNEAVVVSKDGGDIFKKDNHVVQSAVCSVMQLIEKKRIYNTSRLLPEIQYMRSSGVPQDNLLIPQKMKLSGQNLMKYDF